MGPKAEGRGGQCNTLGPKVLRDASISSLKAESDNFDVLRQYLKCWLSVCLSASHVLSCKLMHGVVTGNCMQTQLTCYHVCIVAISSHSFIKLCVFVNLNILMATLSIQKKILK